MTTVGEMVEGMRHVHWLEVDASVWETKEKYPMYWDAAESVLRDLGIWDAEVLECVMRDSEQHEDFEPVPCEGTWKERGYLYKECVRVIVLKEE